jgi:hypothetical protein
MISPNQNEPEGPPPSLNDSANEAGRMETPEEVEDARTTLDANSENLLDRLLYKGVLPRYAFPTDVATFYIFNEEEYTRYNPRFAFKPSQGLPIALSQYAPGKTICVSNKFYTSGAIYSPLNLDREKAWDKRKLYYECKSCGFALTKSLADGTLNEQLDCDACKNSQAFGPAKFWLIPPGFAHPIDIDVGTTSNYQTERSYPTAAKLTVPANDQKWKPLNNYLRIYHTRENLLVTNSGPRDDGYTYCRICGRIESQWVSNLIQSAHLKPFPDSTRRNCPRGNTVENLVLGTDFITDILLISIRVIPPLNLRYSKTSSKVALRTLSEALKKAACTMLELEEQELEAEFRLAFTEDGRNGLEAEIYLYDTLPGGAGFTKRMGDLGLDVFTEALKVLTECPEKCDLSCYRCLRSYKNKFKHQWLDRHLGSNLLKYLLSGKFTSDSGRLNSSAKLLYEDLDRQGKEFTITLNKTISPPGFSQLMIPIHIRRLDGQEFAIILCDSLTPDSPATDELSDFLDNAVGIVPQIVDELEVRKCLPMVTSKLISDIS